MTDPVRLIRECPIGWDSDGKLLRPRSSEDADVVTWVTEVDVALRELIDARASKLELEARSVSGARHRSGYDEAAQMVALELANLDRQIARHKLVADNLVHHRERLEIVRKSFEPTDGAQLPLPKLEAH